jgi:NAD(P)-dependent dehydrogenase (short-subunit alcohol dehydrogenase family)
METSPEVFENTWRLHAFGAFLWSRQVVPAMLSRGSGSILITGATAGVRPWPNSASFAPAKFAVRGLAQVMARDLHPHGIHVGYINVDGGIDMPFLRKLRPDAQDEDSPFSFCSFEARQTGCFISGLRYYHRRVRLAQLGGPVTPDEVFGRHRCSGWIASRLPRARPHREAPDSYDRGPGWMLSGSVISRLRPRSRGLPSCHSRAN